MRELTYLTRARLTLLVGYDDAQRPFGCRQRLAVPLVGKQDHAVGESMIQFRESEDGAVIIPHLSDKKQSQTFAPHLLTELHASLFDE